MNWFLVGAALLHVAFMLCELFPWSSPLLLQIVSRKLPPGHAWTPVQRPLAATIVHNAGIYNAIVAGSLFWTALPGSPSPDMARVILIGTAVAGVFGTVTLKSWVTAIQAIVGIVGLAFV